MKRVILFGAGNIAKLLIRNCENGTHILAIADNKYENISSCEGHLVIDPQKIVEYEYDEIVITLDDTKIGNDREIISIYKQLLNLGIDDEKIILQSMKYRIESKYHKPRTDYVYCLAEYFDNVNIKGAVAECGVYRGWFSGILGDAFPKSTLYLFDSFEGFSKKDLELDSIKAKEWIKNGAQKRLSNTSEEIVRLRIKNRERLVIRKGFVPETFNNINEKFMFANLDMDLYSPQYEALKWFALRMVDGGVILLHDYFNDSLPGTKKAIEKFNGIDKFSVMPIGDMRSIALIKK